MTALRQAFEAAARERGLAPAPDAIELAGVVGAAYPALEPQLLTRPEDVMTLARERLLRARDLRAYRRLAAPFASNLSDLDQVRRGLRLFAQRERLRIAARELASAAGADVDVTARELSDLAQVCIEIAVAEALRWATARFGEPVGPGGARCAFTVLGMGKLGGRELNAGSDVDLLPFYESDEGEVVLAGKSTEQSLHEHFTRVTQRFTSTLDDATSDGLVWRVDLRLRPEGSRGPLVNALAAAERYYETWGRTWERAALLRARPVAGDLAFGERLLRALAPFVWRRVVDPRIAREMTDLVVRARAELSSDPERDLKLGPGGIREAEFFVQALQLVWGGREPSLRVPNTLEALRRLRARGLVTDREGRDVEAAYLALRRVEHRVQNATGIQTHALPQGELLEIVARSLGHATGRGLERELDRARRRVATRFASLTKDTEPAAGDEALRRLAPLLVALDSGDERAVLAALAGGGGLHLAQATPDLARHLLALARRPDFPLGVTSRDRYPALTPILLDALAGAADPEQASRLLAAFFARLLTPSVYVRAAAEDPQIARKLVALFGASAFLGESLVYHPELVESVLFVKRLPSPERARREVDDEVREALHHPLGGAHPRGGVIDPEDALVGALRRAKARVMMEVGLAELAGELRTREAGLVLTAAADATLEHATQRALEEKGLSGGLAVVAMGKLGGREIGYGSDLDVLFVYDGSRPGASDEPERYVRAAQRVLRLVSAPHGEGPGYELDTRLRPSGSHGLLVVSLESFARYHGFATAGPSREGPGAGLVAQGPGEAQAWERQALVKARPCAGDPEVGRRVLAIAHAAAYERGAPDPHRMNHLRRRMERELARESPSRHDVKLGRGGIVDVEFAVQWLQMKHGGDVRVRTTETEAALAALQSCGYLDAPTAAVLREGYSTLRRLEQALRVVHGTSANLIEEGAPGLGALARRMGFRDRPHRSAAAALLEHYRALTRDVRSAYLSVLGLPRDGSILPPPP